MTANPQRERHIEHINIIGPVDGKYRVYAYDEHGHRYEMHPRAITVMLHESGRSEAVLYFPDPVLNVTAKRSADGVRAG